MQTELIKINNNAFSEKELKKAVKILRNNEIIIFPTETVYGIGANAFNKKAVQKIFKAKNRPVDNPLIIHISNTKQLKKIVLKLPIKAKILMKEFWPGPLTIILKKSKNIPLNVTAGLDSVAVRMPSNKIALKLIEMCQFPIAAPSANISGKPSSTKGAHAFDDFNGKVKLIIDSGECEHGIESTVISLIGKPLLLRPGAITKEDIEKIIGKIIVPKNNNNKKPISPGLKYKHYSPEAKVFLCLNQKNFELEIQKNFEKHVGIISFSKKIGVKNEYFFNKNISDYAKNVFSCFREFDKKKVELIIMEGVKKKGLGLALMNRIEKASTKII